MSYVSFIYDFLRNLENRVTDVQIWTFFKIFVRMKISGASNIFNNNNIHILKKMCQITNNAHFLAEKKVALYQTLIILTVCKIIACLHCLIIDKTLLNITSIQTGFKPKQIKRPKYFFKMFFAFSNLYLLFDIDQTTRKRKIIAK